MSEHFCQSGIAFFFFVFNLKKKGNRHETDEVKISVSNK